MKDKKFHTVLRSKTLTSIVASVILASTFSYTKVHAANIISRFDGADRYETAAKVCEDGWQQGTDYAVIVNGENFPDALSAAPIAKKYDAPILLTGKDILNPYTSVELNRLGVKNVFIVGGKGVVSQSIEDALKARGIKVTRLGGANRYETSILIAQKLGKSDAIALVNGEDFHDGLSIAPIAALKGMPIILTSKDYMPDVVKKYIQANKTASQIYMVGGTSQISDGIANSIPNGKRIGDGDAYARNTAVINEFQNEVSTGTLYIASAKDFPDALVASALAPKTASPILYVDDPLSYATQFFLKSKMVNDIKVLGGTASVSDDAQQTVAAMPLDLETINDLTDTIWQNQKYTPRPTITVKATDGNVKEVPVDWSLTKINTSKPGIYTISGKIKGTDRSVITTLIVKPLPVKINDIATKVANGNDFSLPDTVSAQMSDGTISMVPVNWDYGSQQGNNPGTYIFTGTVDHYAKKVKLTLTSIIPPQILSIQDIKLKLSTLSDFKYSPYYTSIPASINDGTTKNVAVTWDSSSMTEYPDYPGVYECTGTVSGYNDAVHALLITGNASDPTPDEPTTTNNSGGVATYLPAMDIMQGDSYNLPTTAADPISGKQLQVTWTTTNIDTNLIDTGDVETSRVSSMTFAGTLTGSTAKVGIVVNVRPKIAGIDPDSLKQTISRSSYSGTTYRLPTTLTAVMPDGSNKNISVLSWDVPYIDTGVAQTYYIKGKVKWYSNTVTFVLTVTD